MKKNKTNNKNNNKNDNTNKNNNIKPKYLAQTTTTKTSTPTSFVIYTTITHKYNRKTKLKNINFNENIVIFNSKYKNYTLLN